MASGPITSLQIVGEIVEIVADFIFLAPNWERSMTRLYIVTLLKVKEESEKVGLKLNIQKMKIMASGPITSLQIDGETVETVADFIFLGSKTTSDGDCSHDIKKMLTLWKESYDQPRQHIKKQRHYFVQKVSRLWFFHWSCMDVRVGL